MSVHRMAPGVILKIFNRWRSGVRVYHMIECKSDNLQWCHGLINGAYFSTGSKESCLLKWVSGLNHRYELIFLVYENEKCMAVFHQTSRILRLVKILRILGSAH